MRCKVTGGGREREGSIIQYSFILQRVILAVNMTIDLPLSGAYRYNEKGTAAGIKAKHTASSEIDANARTTHLARPD